MMWNITQIVHSSFVFERVGQRLLAYFTLELSPVDICEMVMSLFDFFSFDPAFQAFIMDEFDSSSTLTNLKQRVLLVEIVIPAQSTLSILDRDDAFEATSVLDRGFFFNFSF